MQKFKKLCYLVGAYKFGEFTYSTGKVQYDYHMQNPYDLKQRYDGGYALITGATGGLGLIFAKQLATRGFNLVLVGRNQERLDKAKQEVQELCGENIDIKLVQFDFSSTDVDSYSTIFDQTKDLDISLLINNVGANNGIRNLENSKSNQALKDVAVVNMLPTTLLSKHYANIFLQKQSKTGIINVGSIGGQFPIFFNSDYCASKAYVNQFTRNITLELKESDIDFQLLYPGRMPSEMTKNAPKIFYVRNFSVPPEEVITNSLNLLGQQTEVMGHPKFDFLLGFYNRFTYIAENLQFLSNLTNKHLWN